MFRSKKTRDDQSNFWISYADLMAGLLFVFILLIGAIISKSIILKQHLSAQQQKLEQLSSKLQAQRLDLEHLMQKLHADQSAIKQLRSDLLQTRQRLTQKEKTIKQKEQTITRHKAAIALKDEEIAKLKKMLLEANARADMLNQKVIIVQNLLKEHNATIQKVHKKLEAYEGKVLVLSSALQEANRTLSSQNEKILALLNALDEKKTSYDTLIETLRKQKAKIKSLTGIRLKVITALKEALGKQINIDKESGSLKLSSSILFDKGSATLKEEAKESLAKAFDSYIATLMEDPRIAPHLHRIIIEGHTDSDGEYIYNLKLSQARALAVMRYLLSLPISKRYDLKPLMIAAGRSYVDPVIRNGKEDKEASRRIEIKFDLKNDEAMEEIEKVLDAS